MTRIRAYPLAMARAGIGAGLLFGAAQCAAAAVVGLPASWPLRLFASLLLGVDALAVVPVPTVLLTGLLVHLVLSAIFGVLYGVVAGGVTPEVRLREDQQILLGILYGTALWLFDVQIVARLFFPWFFVLPQLMQWLLHALFFGLPLAYVYGAIDRRATASARP